MSWHTSRLLALDTESTGVDVDTARIVTAAAIHVGGGQTTDTTSWLSDVDGEDIPAAATAIHGVDTAAAHADGTPAGEVVEELLAVLTGAVAARTPVVGHNVVYDLTLIDREARRHHGHGLDGAFDLEQLRVIDTRVLDQQVLPRRRRVSPKQGPRQLITLAQVYNLGWDPKAAHGSTYDALMAARIAYRIGSLVQMPREARPEFEFGRFQQFDQLAGLDLDGLHAAQVVWAAEQAAGLEQFFREKDPAAYVERAWPLIPFEAVAADA